MKLKHPFIRLPFRFDVEQLRKELANFDQSVWMPHPNGLKGNSAMPLISKDGEDNDHFHGSMKVTPHLQRCEYIQQVIASFGEVFGRSRLMKLESGCEVSAHTDTNYHWHSRVRIHIPITTFPEVIFHCGDSAVNMQAGECWLFDSWQQHQVVNGSEHTRVHLVIDTSGSSRFWQMVDSAEVPGLKKGPKDSLLSYQKGKSVSIATERFNNTPVMSPGDLDGLVEGLLLDFAANKSNPQAAADAYAQVLFDLSKDWRSQFYLHGYQDSGAQAYAGLLEHYAARIQSLPDTVFTASNAIPVKDIIFFKIFSAAVAPAVRDEFMSMNQQARKKPVTAASKQQPVSRNQPCPCGSGKKYKRCHGAAA